MIKHAIPISLILLCGSVLSGGEILKFQTVKPWVAEPDGSFSIQYPGKEWPQLVSKVQTKAESYMQVSFEAQGPPENPLLLSLTADDAKFLQSFEGDGKWNRYSVNFRTGKTGSVLLKFYLNPGASVKAAVRKVEVKKLEGSGLFDGNFESGNTIAAFWSKGWKNRNFIAELVPSKDFISGVTSMEITPNASEQYMILSHPLPIQPGKTVNFRFWAKGVPSCRFIVWIDCYNTVGKHTGKHLYKEVDLSADSEWKQFQCSLAIPTDISSVPDVASGFCRIQLRFPPAKNGEKLLLDNLAYELK